MDWISSQFDYLTERIAGFEDGVVWTFGNLSAEILAFEKQFESLPAYSTIALRSTHTIRGITALLACAKQRLIPLPIGTDWTNAEIQERKTIAAVGFEIWIDHKNTKLKKLSGLSATLPLIEHLRQREHAGLILFTSGTTGTAKAMLHDLDSLLGRFRGLKTRNDRSLQILTWDHIGGLDSAFRSLFAGSSLVIPKGRTPREVAQAIEQHEVNVLPTTPTFLNLMLLSGVQDQFDLQSLEIIAYGAEAMPDSLLQRLVATFPEVDLQQKFGTSETGTIRIKSIKKSSLKFRIADNDAQWKVVDAELWLKTPSRILGYLNAEVSGLEEDGWYRTGDLVEETEEGVLRILDRKNNLINIGGEKVSPLEIENVLLKHPKINDCIVYSEPNPITGQSMVAELVVQKESKTSDLKREIKRHCRERLPDFKVPARIKLVEATALTASLKKQRRPN